MADDAMSNAIGMMATGVGIGVLGMGAGVAIKSIGNAMDITPKKKSVKRKSKKRRK